MIAAIYARKSGEPTGEGAEGDQKGTALMASVRQSKFYEQQFQLQLELEDLNADQLQAHGEEYRDRANGADVSRPSRIDLAVRVLLALKRIPRLKLDPFEAEDRFVIWCSGFGIPEGEVFDEMARMIQQSRERSKP